MAVVMPAGKPRRRRSKPAPPVIRRRIFDGRRIHRVAVAIGYLFCLWVGARVSFAASVAVSEQAVRIGQVIIDTLDRGLDDRDEEYFDELEKDR